MRTRAACSGATAAARSITSACTAASTSRSARCRRRWARSAATSPAAATLIDFLYHRARPFLFSTSHPPSVTATLPRGARPAARGSRELIDRLWENTRFFKAGLRDARLRHRPQREPDHAGDGRRRRPGDAALRSAVRRKASSRRASPSPPWRRTRRASAPSSPRRTRARNCSSRSTYSRRSAGNWVWWRDV